MGNPYGHPKPQYEGMTLEEKKKAYSKACYEKHAEERRAYGRKQSKKYREENRDMVLAKKLDQWLRDIFKKSTEWYEEKLKEQDGHCALCDTKPNSRRLQVDHNHDCCPTSRGGNRKTCGECTRGLLCEKCNTKIGYLEQVLEDVLTMGTIVPKEGTWLFKALAYLDSYKRI